MENSSEAVIDDVFTREGTTALLDINDGDKLVFARLSSGATLKIGNKVCSLRPLIACPFGSMFHVENGVNGPYLCRVYPASPGSTPKKNFPFDPKVETRDNRGIVDDNTAQSLNCDDIDNMKRQGVEGHQIVEALTVNSSTFRKKTSFSQEKYLLKKQKKYAPKAVLRRPSARSICEAYFKKHPSRIGCMRMDTLSMLLSLANVSSGCDVLVVDMVGGLLTGAAAERLGGCGYVCNTYFGAVPYPVGIAGLFNFSREMCERVVSCPFADLKCDEQKMEIDEPLFEEDGGPSVGQIRSHGIGQRAPHESVLLWKENGFSSLLIAAPAEVNVWNLVRGIMPLLACSAAFAVYHQYLQPLATCMHNLHVQKLAVDVRILEPWMREYQVLPSRTHPLMQASGTGGYILSGIRTFF